MKKITIASLFAFAVCFGFGCDNANKPEDSVEQAEEMNETRMDSMDHEAGANNKVDADDQAEFMVEAASSGMMEVALGNMAAKQAQNAEVKAFAKMMVAHHTKSGEELKDLAAAKSVTLPERVGNEHQKHIDKLADLRGADFDREYMNIMVKAHQEDVEEFKEGSQENDYDAETKAMIKKSLPMLEQHLQQAKQLRDKVGGSNTTNTTTTTTTKTGETQTTESPKR